MKYILVKVKPENNFLDSIIYFYDEADGYLYLKSETIIGSLITDPIIQNISNVMTWFIVDGAGKWTIKTMHVRPAGAKEVGHMEDCVFEVPSIDPENHNLETVNGQKFVIDKIVNIFDLTITDESQSIANSERTYYINTNGHSLEEDIDAVWKHFTN